MRNLEKYKGVIPAFYACYDNEGNVSPEGVQALTKYFVEKGVKGVYVNGSSGECIYQTSTIHWIKPHGAYWISSCPGAVPSAVPWQERS